MRLWKSRIAMVDTQARQMMDEFAQRIQSQGLPWSSISSSPATDSDKMLEEMKPQALKRNPDQTGAGGCR